MDVEGGRSQIELIGLNQNDLENGADIRYQEIRKDTSRCKDDKFLTTILNSKCQKPFKQIPEGRWKYKLRAAESHLSYFHIEKIIEIIRVFGVGIA